MRHLKAGRKLNRSGAHRRALFRNMVTSLLLHERVQTTDAKAKELRRWADRMVTLGKRGTLHARRQAMAFVRSRRVVKKLFEEIAPRFQSRPGGYTRVVKLASVRHGDAAPLAIVELTERGDRAVSEAEKKRERKRRAAQRKEQAGGGPRPGA
jgi:large subunit ribosomal protein L17